MAVTDLTATPAPRSGAPGVLRRTFRAPRARVGVAVLALVVLAAVLGPVLSRWDPFTSDVTAFGRPPTALHWFGTDSSGRDLYVRTLVGLRTSLAVGLVAGPLSTLVAAVVGAVGGYLGGRVDRVVVWGIDLALVLPSFYLLVLLAPTAGRAGWFAVALAIALLGWMVMARLVRAQARSLRRRDFVTAARFLGVPTGAVLRRHVLPHLASLLVVDATLGVAAAVLTEATLGWVGLGLGPPAVSLGTLLAAGSASAVTRPWLFWFPAGLLVVTVLATSLVGDALRDALDPTTGTAGE
ncbi:hypothetical protein CELL_02313 [Cellulomonas sp. T2.31MG-18]|uniref:ABC transporter permease n=1 Tax=Cellulomonas sp. T2.31MG-18 TaxID=3157619 RepID=UPI0035E745A3